MMLAMDAGIAAGRAETGSAMLFGEIVFANVYARATISASKPGNSERGDAIANRRARSQSCPWVDEYAIASGFVKKYGGCKPAFLTQETIQWFG